MFYGKVIGGLGNQMFQVSFYNYLSKVLDMNFIIDISDFDNDQLHNGFELAKIFNLKLLSTKKQRNNVNVGHCSLAKKQRTF